MQTSKDIQTRSDMHGNLTWLMVPPLKQTSLRPTTPWWHPSGWFPKEKKKASSIPKWNGNSKVDEQTNGYKYMQLCMRNLTWLIIPPFAQTASAPTNTMSTRLMMKPIAVSGTRVTGIPAFDNTSTVLYLQKQETHSISTSRKAHKLCQSALFVPRLENFEGLARGW